MLVDTNIFIDFFKGNIRAQTFFEQKKHFSTSLLCVMEAVFESFLQSAQIVVYPIDENISKKAYELFVAYNRKIGIGIADAFIASTTIIKNTKLITLNTKHFMGIKGLVLAKPY